LILVPEVWEVEMLLMRSDDHVVEAVFRVLDAVVGVYCHQDHASICVVFLDLDHSVFVVLHGGTVVAAENYGDRFLVFVVL